MPSIYIFQYYFQFFYLYQRYLGMDISDVETLDL
ncbi:Uncharacterised protein [Yersinia intermedia]|uniref:Uncharacterized protein n=1 Tax=Yersinia intermedia TaxID=631 RepID=A0A0H5MEU7_YERIN|nr:Uncharacterised protein [Yersinia intermedia]